MHGDYDDLFVRCVEQGHGSKLFGWNHAYGQLYVRYGEWIRKKAIGEVANGNSTTNFTSYDAMGNVLTSNQVTGGVTYPFNYTYNLASGLTQEAPGTISIVP